MHNNNNYHNNNNQCKMCLNKALTFGVGSIKLCFRTIVFTCKDVYNPNVITFQSNCAVSLHLVLFIIIIIIIVIITNCAIYVHFQFFQVCV